MCCHCPMGNLSWYYRSGCSRSGGAHTLTVSCVTCKPAGLFCLLWMEMRGVRLEMNGALEVHIQRIVCRFGASRYAGGFWNHVASASQQETYGDTWLICFLWPWIFAGCCSVSKALCTCIRRPSGWLFLCPTRRRAAPSVSAPQWRIACSWANSLGLSKDVQRLSRIDPDCSFI